MYNEEQKNKKAPRRSLVLNHYNVNIMSESSYLTYHQTLINQLIDTIRHSAPFNGDELDELQAQFIEKVEELHSEEDSTPQQSQNCQQEDTPYSQNSIGQWVLCRIVADYPHFMPSVPRDLFWYFGGECMHYLSDEEIRFFQSVDEAFHDACRKNANAVDYAELLVAATAPPAGKKPH